MISLRDGEDQWLRKKRLRDLNSAESAILRNVRDRMVLETHQATSQQKLSFPKILNERQARKTQRANTETRIQELLRTASERFNEASLVLQAVVEPYSKTHEGELVRAIAIPWKAIVQRLEKDWTEAYKIPPRVWEQIIAAAYDRDGFDEVTLTPGSGDFGRDVIAVKRGIGCIRIVDSVKAYAAHRLVRHDDVRALWGVVAGDPLASKGILTTTSDFAPGIATDPILSPQMPFRLELVNGARLQQWLAALAK
jgi:restriction system protein